MGKESGVPCVQWNRIAARARWRLRFDRARAGDFGHADRANGAARHVVLPDDFAVLRRLGARGYAGRKARRRARSGACMEFQLTTARALAAFAWPRHGLD